MILIYEESGGKDTALPEPSSASTVLYTRSVSSPFYNTNELIVEFDNFHSFEMKSGSICNEHYFIKFSKSSLC